MLSVSRILERETISSQDDLEQCRGTDYPDPSLEHRGGLNRWSSFLGRTSVNQIRQSESKDRVLATMNIGHLQMFSFVPESREQKGKQEGPGGSILQRKSCALPKWSNFII